jgi:MtN3 and saliva related transmembrane protein
VCIPAMLTFLGLLAAGMTSLSYIPQVRKAVPRGSTDDLSLKTLIVLSAGLGLWVVYGAFKGDWVIILANSVGFALVAVLLVFKIRDAQWFAKATAETP